MKLPTMKLKLYVAYEQHSRLAGDRTVGAEKRWLSPDWHPRFKMADVPQWFPAIMVKVDPDPGRAPICSSVKFTVIMCPVWVLLLNNNNLANEDGRCLLMEGWWWSPNTIQVILHNMAHLENIEILVLITVHSIWQL